MGPREEKKFRNKSWPGLFIRILFYVKIFNLEMLIIVLLFVSYRSSSKAESKHANIDV